MKKIKSFLEIILLTIIVGIVVWYVFFNKPIPEVVYEYTTDTIYDSIPYSVPEPYAVYTPPITLTEYMIDSALLDSMELLLQDQYIIIAHLQDSIKVHANYLKLYPLNPKVLGIDMKKDTFEIGLLEIAGITRSYRWPIDLNFYSYRWNLEDGFTRERLKPTLLSPTLKEPFANYFVGGNVDIFHRTPMITARAEKQLSSVRLYISTQLGLLDLNSSNFQVGVEYHINGKKHN